MGFQELLDGRTRLYPKGTSDRYRLLDAYERLRDGRIYDHLKHAFSKERDGDAYIPMMDRRPSVVYKLIAVVVNQCAALLFGDEHAPTPRCWNNDTENNPYEVTEQSAELLIDRLDIEATMQEAVIEGSPGSVAIIVRSVGDERKPYIEVLAGKFCLPVFDIIDPTKLVKLPILYPTKGQDLLDVGYEIAELLDPGQKPEDFKATDDYWVRIEIDEDEEIRYFPLSDRLYQRLGEKDPLTQRVIVKWIHDDERSFPHEFGCVPVVYIRQFRNRGVDGLCLFDGVTDACIEIDYLLSQIGRGLRYSADPLLAISRGELAAQNAVGPIGEQALRGEDGSLAKTASNVLPLENGSVAQLLEISGQGLAVAGEHVAQLREYVLEVLSGMKSDSTHEKGVQSGRALDKLWECLKLLIKRLRVPYGNQGLIPLLRIIMRGFQVGALVVEGVDPSKVNPDAPYRLIWPQTSLPEGADLFATAQALTAFGGASRAEGKRLVDDDSLTRCAAAYLGITDANAAVKARQKADDEDAADAEQQAELETQRQIKITKAKPAPKPPAAKK